MKEKQRRPEQNGEKMSRGQRDPTEDARAKIDTQRSEKSCPREGHSHEMNKINAKQKINRIGAKWVVLSKTMMI